MYEKDLSCTKRTSPTGTTVACDIAGRLMQTEWEEAKGLCTQVCPERCGRCSNCVQHYVELCGTKFIATVI